MTTKDLNTSIPTWAFTLASTALLGSSIALASPEGGDVVEGDATIEYMGDWTRVLTGEITIIDWLSFNIAHGETVEFVMPSEASRVLNRITNGVPTEIMGNLIGNGQIFIVNPSGVIFGQNAVVNVGALYAAAGNISNSDFSQSVYRFTDARGIVENRGHLQGDLIALIGGRVANHGTISAPNGTVVMAAGEQVLIGELLGHTFVRVERPTDLENTPPLDTDGAPSLTAGDVFSLAAWNTGTIDGKETTIAVSAGHMAIDADITAGELSLIADSDSHIELGANLHSDESGIVITGDVILTDDVSITSDGSVIAFKGSVDSEFGAEHDLFVNTNGGGHVRFTEGVGANGRLGILDVSAPLIRFFGNVSVNDQLNLYGPVAISNDSMVFDVGLGSALFGSDVYSFTHGRSSVAFLYDGQAWVGQGSARAPYQFRSGIGLNGAFRNITLGGDLGDPSRSSAFVFATGAMPGLDLIGADTDLNHQFLINATESIVMGQGQKMTSFGSLALNANGSGFTTIAVGDLSVLGDLRIASVGQGGGQILFNTRAPGEVDWFGNEDDRGDNALMDEGLELIASGDITLIGSLGGGGEVRLGSGGTIQLFNNSGTGNAGSLDIDLFPGGVSLDLFAGMLANSQGTLYPYDLTLIPMGTNPGTRANLAEALDEEPAVRLRTTDPYLAARQVLLELGLNPQDPSFDEIRSAQTSGAKRYIEDGIGTTDDAVAFGVTIDRLNRSTVARLTDAYVGLLGERTGDGLDRSNDGAVVLAISKLWVERHSSFRTIDALLASGEIEDMKISSTMGDLDRLITAIELLELSPVEIAQAKRALIVRFSNQPDQIINRWFSPAPMAMNAR